MTHIMSWSCIVMDDTCLVLGMGQTSTKPAEFLDAIIVREDDE